MNRFTPGWFTEANDLWPGQAQSLEVSEILHESVSETGQRLLVFSNPVFGRVLCINEIIQITDLDEHAYQEMIAHLPLFTHPHPRKVLIIGGGDGGVLREVCRHPADVVEEIHMCEIDQSVIDVCKEHLPTIHAGSFDDARVTLFIQDGFEFLRTRPEAYDVIIVDSTDPIGPGVSLYQKDFFGLCSASLRSGGVFANQSECLWINLPEIKSWRHTMQSSFTKVDYAYTLVPTYPCGTIGFLVGQKDVVHVDRVPAREISQEMKRSLKYYSEEMHKASFVLPPFARRKIYGEEEEEE